MIAGTQQFRMAVNDKLDSPERTFDSVTHSETIWHCPNNSPDPKFVV